MIICEMFHRIIFLNSVLLRPVNFVSGFRLEFMNISFIISISSSLTHFHGFQLLVLLPWFIMIVAKRVLEAAKITYANKIKESHFSETFLSVLFSASDKTKLSPKNFSENSILDDLGIYLPVFLSRTNLKQHHISVSPKMIKKVVPNLDSSKASGLDYILVVGLKKCESKLNTYLLNSSICVCLKESCFSYCWKISSLIPVLKSVWGRSTTKNYHHVSLLSVVSKGVNNRIIDHPNK